MRFCVHPIMRSSVGLAAVVVASLAQSVTAVGQVPLREHIDPARIRVASDSFAVVLQGKPRGWQRLRVSRVDAGWQLADAITIDTVVTQESISTLDADLGERSLRQEGRMQGKPMKIVLDWSAGRVRGTAMTPSAGPAGTLTFDTIAVAGAIDDNSITPLLHAVRWRDSLAIAVPVFSSGRGTTASYRLTVSGAEQVTVPAGQFDTWRIEMRAERSLLIANVTRSAPYRIVRMRNGPAFDVQLLK
jgi:hypothetical protein